MKPCLAVITRSLLAHQYNLFFEAYKGDYAELFPERIIDHDGKQSCILPVTQAITKQNTSGDSITMDLKTFAHVSLICPFGGHMPVGHTGVQLSIVNGCHQLAKHTVLASFQFNPGGYLSQGFVFDPGGLTQLLKSLQTSCDVIINNGEQSVKYYIHDASDMNIVGTDGHTGWSCFRQNGSDKNHTGLIPLRISAIHGFVFTSDQVCPKGSMIIGPIVGTYFSHGFSTYSHVFGAIQSSSGSPSTTRGTLCMGYVDSSTWYSSYMSHVGISIPMVATHWLHLSYNIYVQAMLAPSMQPYVIYNGLSLHPTMLAY